MANRTVIQLDAIATSAATSAGLAAIHIETQIDGISSPESRQLGLDQVASLIVTDQKVVRATTPAMGVAVSSASVTGTLSINTGLSAVAHVMLTIRGVLSSSVNAVSWSALASAGWFAANVYANPLSSSSAAAASTIPATVDWIAVGTL